VAGLHHEVGGVGVRLALESAAGQQARLQIPAQLRTTAIVRNLPFTDTQIPSGTHSKPCSPVPADARGSRRLLCRSRGPYRSCYMPTVCEDEDVVETLEDVPLGLVDS
jgi:hypothetical protein